jgi:hypothetical protein
MECAAQNEELGLFCLAAAAPVGLGPANNKAYHSQFFAVFISWKK